MLGNYLETAIFVNKMDGFFFFFRRGIKPTPLYLV